jgi:hypothetical protein
MIYLYVILSGVLLDEGEKNRVEGSHVVCLKGERPEIPRLRKTSFVRSFASLGMTFKLLTAE